MVIPGTRWPLIIGLIITYMAYSFGAPSTTYETNNELNNAIAEELIGDNMVDNEDNGYNEDLAEEIAAEKDKLAIEALQSYARNKILSAKSQKRLSSGFYGSRGKKEALPSGFFGARGKKANPPQSFYGARGKRLVRSTNGRDLYYASGKRIDPNSFFGMRGKRTQEESYPLLVSQQQYYKTIPQQSLTGDDEHYFYDSNDDSNGHLNNFDDNNNSVAEELSDKEKLLALVDYYLSMRNERNSAYRLAKVKRQPPSGFHAIRGR